MQNTGMVGILLRFCLKGKVNMYQFPKHEIKTINIFHKYFLANIKKKSR